jgi:Flp pilus assembly protein TadD
LKKAISLLDRLDAIPEDLRLAEEIAQGALDKAPTDPETVTAMARVQTTWLTRGWDRASDRYLKAQRVAERAVQLAPDEPQALAALAAYLLQRGTDQSRARGLIARAIELDPGSPRLHRLQNELRFFDAKVPREEAFASINRTLAQFPGDALVHYDASRYYRNAGRFEESEREVDATLALAPVANAMVWKARAEFGLHNNLPGMKAALDRVPARVRSIERTVFGYFIYAVMSGDHAVGVGALNDMPEPWMIDFDYRGPKALPLAALLELQGKPALARIQCEVALKEVKQRQATEPDDLFLKLVEAWALHGLGRDDEARAAVRIFNESIERPYRITRMNSWWFHPIACNLVLGERATALALVREAGEIPAGRETVRRFLASDPRLAAFRDDAEITALLQEPETAKP